MLARRHVAIGGETEPRFIFFNRRFIDVGEDGTLALSSAFSGLSVARFGTQYGAIAYFDSTDSNRFLSISFTGSRASAAYLLLDRGEVLVDGQELKYDAFTDVTWSYNTRLYKRALGGSTVIGAISTRLFTVEYSFNLGSFGYVNDTILAYSAGGLAFDYVTTTMYICDRTNDKIRIYDSINSTATELMDFSTATELTEPPILCELNDDGSVLYVMDKTGKVAAYDVSSGNEGTALGTIALSSFTSGINNVSDAGNMKYDATNSVLYITEGREGNAIYAIDVSNHASMSATRIAGSTAMVGGSMVKRPISVDIKYGQLFIFSGRVDGDTDVQVICVDNSSALSTSSDVLGSLTGAQLGSGTETFTIGYGKVF